MALLATGISIDIARIPPEVTIPTLDADNAEALALRALAFVAGDEERLRRFLLLSGLTLDELRDRAGDPRTLSGVLDHLMSDERLLMEFAEAEEIDPALIPSSRRFLPGVPVE